MNYRQALTSLFSQPKWGVTLLLGGLAMLVPIVGPLVWMGYCIDNLRRGIEAPGTGDEDFQFEKIGRYLGLSIWPFVASLVAMLITLPLVLLLVVIVVVGIVMAQAAESAVLMVFAVLLIIALALVVNVVVQVVMMPVMLRAALTQSIGGALNWPGLRDYLRHCGGATLIAALFLLIISVPVGIVGYLACLVGVYPAMAYLVHVQWQIEAQLHDLHQSRGGEPIPMGPGLIQG